MKHFCGIRLILCMLFGVVQCTYLYAQFGDLDGKLQKTSEVGKESEGKLQEAYLKSLRENRKKVEEVNNSGTAINEIEVYERKKTQEWLERSDALSSAINKKIEKESESIQTADNANQAALRTSSTMNTSYETWNKIHVSEKATIQMMIKKYRDAKSDNLFLKKTHSQKEIIGFSKPRIFSKSELNGEIERLYSKTFSETNDILNLDFDPSDSSDGLSKRYKAEISKEQAAIKKAKVVRKISEIVHAITPQIEAEQTVELENLGQVKKNLLIDSPSNSQNVQGSNQQTATEKDPLSSKKELEQPARQVDEIIELYETNPDALTIIDLKVLNNYLEQVNAELDKELESQSTLINQ